MVFYCVIVTLCTCDKKLAFLKPPKLKVIGYILTTKHMGKVLKPTEYGKQLAIKLIFPPIYKDLYIKVYTLYIAMATCTA